MEAMSFEEIILPHLDSAYNLARWLTRNPDDAQDVVQEALVRAFKYFAGYRGGDSRAWLLTIVRNTSYSWLGRKRSPALEFRDEDDLDIQGEDQSNPEVTAVRGDHG